MKTSIFLFVACIGMSAGLTAQNNTVSAGGNAAGAGGTSAYSVGQLAYSTSSGVNGTITEGLQQPYEISVTTATEDPTVDLDAIVFPNPARDYIELKIDNLGTEQLNYALLDISGRVVDAQIVTDHLTEIPVSTLAQGNYFLTLRNKDRTLKTFQISKAE